MFFAVKTWNFVGLICLLLAGRGFRNCLTGLVVFGHVGLVDRMKRA